MGEKPNSPAARSKYGEEIKYTYFKAKLDTSGKPMFRNGNYVVEENSQLDAWDENVGAGVYVVCAEVEETDFYTGLSYELVLRVSEAESNYWVKAPAMRSRRKGEKGFKPEGKPAYGRVDYSYYRAVYDEADGVYVRGDKIAEPEETGKYLLVATVENAGVHGELTEEVFFEIYDDTPQNDGGGVLLYLSIALGAAVLALAAALITIIIKFKKS